MRRCGCWEGTELGRCVGAHCLTLRRSLDAWKARQKTRSEGWVASRNEIASKKAGGEALLTRAISIRTDHVSRLVPHVARCKLAACMQRDSVGRLVRPFSERTCHVPVLLVHVVIRIRVLDSGGRNEPENLWSGSSHLLCNRPTTDSKRRIPRALPLPRV